MTQEERTKLAAELGELTYQIAKLQNEIRIKSQRSNEIATLFEKEDKQ